MLNGSQPVSVQEEHGRYRRRNSPWNILFSMMPGTDETRRMRELRQVGRPMGPGLWNFYVFSPIPVKNRGTGPSGGRTASLWANIKTIKILIFKILLTFNKRFRVWQGPFNSDFLK
jgi:hypothetical protein